MVYLEILKDISYVSFFDAFVKWILIFLLVSILLLIICTRLGYFSRRTTVAKVLVKFYYVLIPIYFIIFAIKFAPIRNAQVELNKSIDLNKKAISDNAYSFLSSIVADSLITQNKSPKEIVDTYLDSQISKKKESSGYFQSLFFTAIKKIESSFLTRILESEVIKESSNSIGISEKTGKSLYRTDIKTLFKEGQIVEIFKSEMNKHFYSYYKFAFFMFGLGLLIPIIEIILAKRLNY